MKVTLFCSVYMCRAVKYVTEPEINHVGRENHQFFVYFIYIYIVKHSNAEFKDVFCNYGNGILLSELKILVKM